MPTTIKVSTTTRDRLRQRAERHGDSMDRALDRLLREAERSERMEAMRQAMRTTSSQDMASYLAETEEWMNLPAGYLKD